jgi:hypothetical protein
MEPTVNISTMDWDADIGSAQLTEDEEVRENARVLIEERECVEPLNILTEVIASLIRRIDETVILPLSDTTR